MAFVLPIAADGRLVGSATILVHNEERIVLATALHIIGSASRIQVVTPPHGGNCNNVQAYPLDGAPAIEAEVAITNPFADLALLTVKNPDPSAPKVACPTIVNAFDKIRVGAKIVVLGYPFAPIGSMLETWSPGFVTAKARRMIAPSLGIDEAVISNTGHPGSSGSAVVGAEDGVLYGVLRGSLAPPEALKIGDISINADTTVTFATSGHYILELITSLQ